MDNTAAVEEEIDRLNRGWMIAQRGVNRGLGDSVLSCRPPRKTLGTAEIGRLLPERHRFRRGCGVAS